MSSLTKFQYKLWDLVNSDSLALTWSADGKYVFINFHEVKKILQRERIFKTNKLSSFIRNLNLYGFKMINKLSKDRSKKIYFNQYFCRLKFNLLQFITRSGATATARQHVEVGEIKKEAKEELSYDLENICLKQRQSRISRERWRVSVLDDEDRQKLRLRLRTRTPRQMKYVPTSDEEDDEVEEISHGQRDRPTKQIQNYITSEDDEDHEQETTSNRRRARPTRKIQNYITSEDDEDHEQQAISNRRRARPTKKIKYDTTSDDEFHNTPTSHGRRSRPIKQQNGDMDTNIFHTVKEEKEETECDDRKPNVEIPSDLVQEMPRLTRGIYHRLAEIFKSPEDNNNNAMAKEELKPEDPPTEAWREPSFKKKRQRRSNIVQDVINREVTPSKQARISRRNMVCITEPVHQDLPPEQRGTNVQKMEPEIDVCYYDSEDETSRLNRSFQMQMNKPFEDGGEDSCSTESSSSRTDQNILKKDKRGQRRKKKLLNQLLKQLDYWDGRSEDVVSGSNELKDKRMQRESHSSSPASQVNGLDVNAEGMFTNSNMPPGVMNILNNMKKEEEPSEPSTMFSTEESSNRSEDSIGYNAEYDVKLEIDVTSNEPSFQMPSESARRGYWWNDDEDIKGINNNEIVLFDSFHLLENFDFMPLFGGNKPLDAYVRENGERVGIDNEPNFLRTELFYYTEVDTCSSELEHIQKAFGNADFIYNFPDFINMADKPKSLSLFPLDIFLRDILYDTEGNGVQKQTAWLDTEGIMDYFKYY